MSNNKVGFETRINQVNNGLVVCIGCKTFVAKPKDLTALGQYYNGLVPKDYKQFFPDGEETHNDIVAECDAVGVAPEDEIMHGPVDVTGPVGDSGPTGPPGERNIAGNLPTPAVIRTRCPFATVYKVLNGWVVNLPKKGTFIAFTKRELNALMHDW